MSVSYSEFLLQSLKCLADLCPSSIFVESLLIKSMDLKNSLLAYKSRMTLWTAPELINFVTQLIIFSKGTLTNLLFVNCRRRRRDELKLKLNISGCMSTRQFFRQFRNTSSVIFLLRFFLQFWIATMPFSSIRNIFLFNAIMLGKFREGNILPLYLRSSFLYKMLRIRIYGNSFLLLSSHSKHCHWEPNHGKQNYFYICFARCHLCFQQ